MVATARWPRAVAAASAVPLSGVPGRHVSTLPAKAAHACTLRLGLCRRRRSAPAQFGSSDVSGPARPSLSQIC